MMTAASKTYTAKMPAPREPEIQECCGDSETCGCVECKEWRCLNPDPYGESR